MEGKTSVPHLWGLGQMTTAGSAHGSWVHGDGLGVAAKTGLMTAKAMAKYIDDAELGEINEEQVEFFRKRIYESAEYKGEFRPDNVIRYISRLIKRPEFSFNKTEESMNALLAELQDIRRK